MVQPPRTVEEIGKTEKYRWQLMVNYHRLPFFVQLCDSSGKFWRKKPTFLQKNVKKVDIDVQVYNRF